MLSEFEPVATAGNQRIRRTQWKWSRRRPPRALLPVLIALCLAETASSQATLEVQGRVVDERGDPVARAEVELAPYLRRSERYRRLFEGQIHPEPTVAFTTLKDGRYVLEAPEQGMWQVLVRSEGRISVRQLLTPLTEARDLPDAVLRDDSGVVIQVVDQAGKAVPKAQVSASPLTLTRPRRNSTGWREQGRLGLTDEEGRVRLSRSPEVDLRVRGWAAGFLAAEQITVTGVSGVVRLEAGSPVEVKFQGQRKVPVAGAFVGVEGRWWGGGFTDEDGSFVFSLEPDRALEYSLQRSDGATYTGSLRKEAFDLERKDRPVEVITLPAAVELEARVLDAKSREPIAGAFVWSGRDPGHFVRTEADGSYRLKEFHFGSLRLGSRAAGYQASRAEIGGGGGQPSAPTIALSPSATMIGRVVDAEGQGVDSAEVQATRPNSWRHPTVSARGDGSFRFEGLELDETYEFVARAPGFAPGKKAAKLAVGATIEIELARGRSLIGTVVDASRAPLVGAEIRLVPVAGDFRRRMQNRGKSAPDPEETDEEGAFRVTGLGNEPMALLVRAEGLADRLVSDLGLDGGGEVVDAGEIVLEPAVTLRGVVRNKAGSGIESAQVYASVESFMRFMIGTLGQEIGRSAVSGANGDFSIGGLGRGESVSLHIRHEDYVGYQARGILPDGSEPIEIVLDRAARISGRVENEEGQPVGGVNINVRPLAGTEKLSTPYGSFGRGQAWSRSAQDGSFSVAGVMPGEVELSAESSGYLPAQPVRLSVAAGDERSGAVIVLRRGATLEGRVVNSAGDPVPGAHAWIVHETRTFFSSSSRSGASATSDANGRFKLEGLDPVSADLVLRVDHPDYVGFEERFAFEPGLERLVVLVTGTSVSGVVLTEAGEPVSGAQVTLKASRNFFSSREPTTTSMVDGSFEISGVEAAIYELTAAKAGYALSVAETPVEVRGDPVRSLTVYLKLGGTIRGSILGLEAAEFSQLQIMVTGDQRGPSAIGLVDSDGEYRVVNVGIPKGLVRAASLSSGRMAQAEFELDIAGGETWVDLEFPSGATLSGTARIDGEPWIGAQVFVSGGPTGQGGARTNQDGRFEIRGLADGRYQLSITSLGGLPHSQAVEVRGDTEIEVDVRVLKISGRVTAAGSAEPIAGAVVLAEDKSLSRWPAPGAQTSTSSDGQFELRIPSGEEMTLRARADGYTEATTAVNTAAGDLVGVDFELDPGAGLELKVKLWTGIEPRGLHVAVVDESGRRVLAQYLRAVGGRYRVTSIPQGRFGVLVRADESAIVRVPVEIPGPTLELVLPQESRIAVDLESIAENAGPGRLVVKSMQGVELEVPSYDMIRSEWPVLGARTTIRSVPPGQWVVEFVSDSGLVWQQGVTTIAGETAEAKLE